MRLCLAALVLSLCAASDVAVAACVGVNKLTGKSQCCHHAGHRDDIAANCCALRRMQLSGSGLAALPSYIVSRDVNSQTAVDYAGQGALFWSKTASRCLGQASN